MEIQLRNYQIEIAHKATALLGERKIAYLAMECRTGKTLTALETARLYGAKSVLFLTKKKAIPSVEKDYKMLQDVTPLYAMKIVNYESAHKAVGTYDLIIVDEAHSLGAYPRPSKRTQVVKKLCNGKPIIFLSGTPSPESFSQLYHQFWVSDYSPFAEWKTFYQWAHEFVDIRQRKVNGYLINDYSRAYKAKVDEYTDPYFLTYTQAEAGYSTNIREHDCNVELGDQARRILEKLMRDDICYIGDNNDVILGDTPAKKLTKLHQLSSGTVITEGGMRLCLDVNKALYIRDHFQGKNAIFYVYDGEFTLLKKFFPNWTDSPEEFQTSTDKTFICQVRKAREGIRLDSADALIFYNFEYSYLSYEQGKNRIVSKERTTPADVYFLVSDCGIEKDILKAVRDKKDFTIHYYHRVHKNEI